MKPLAPTAIENGIGCTGYLMRTSAEGSGGHHGLNIMRDRAEEVGAALDIDSRSENGTRVMVSWA